MAKVLLVEDDNNLREIYQARLLAEGYDIVTAQNGEEALVVAKQNRPDLIVSDVMMPRISGFEMLDILRNTEELKSTKVIMLTALGQAEDQKRASGLGADKYLVKSQVTLEDIVNAAKELLGEGSAIKDVPAAPPAADPLSTPAADVVTPAPATPTATTPAADPLSIPAVTAPDPLAVPAADPVPAPAPEPPATSSIAVPDPLTAAAPATDTAMPAAEAAVSGAGTQTMAQEEKAVQDQIQAYAQAAVITPTVVEPTTDAETSNTETIAAAVTKLNNAATAEPVEPPTVASAPEPTIQMPAAPVDPVIAAVTDATPPADPLAAAATPTTDTAAPAAAAPAASTAPTAATVPAPVPPDLPTDTAPAAVAGKKVIQPLSSADKPDLDALLAKEEGTAPAIAPDPLAAASTAPAPASAATLEPSAPVPIPPAPPDPVATPDAAIMSAPATEAATPAVPAIPTVPPADAAAPPTPPTAPAAQNFDPTKAL